MANKNKSKTDAKQKTKAPTTADSNVNYLEEQANDLLKIAKEKGLNKNYVFNTTFNRYLTQIELLKLLKNDFSKCETLVTKEYVKGRETITAHPLIAKINSTIDSANKTASLLVKMLTIKQLEVKEEVIQPNELYFMNDNEIILKLGSEEDKRKNLTYSEKKELAERLKNDYLASYEDENENANEFDL